jgi:hypothetical protein
MGGIAWSEWPSYVRGAEFWVVDALVPAVYLNLSYAPSPLPFRLPIILYFSAVVASAFQAEVPEVAFLYC